MKVGIITPAYENDIDFMRACIKQFKGFPTDHLIVISTKSFTGKKLKTSKLQKEAKKLGAKTLVGEFDPDEHQRHAGLDHFKNCDWCLIVDCDEFYTQEDIKKILDFLKTADKEIYKVEKMFVYFKSPDYTATRQDGEHGPPIVAMKPHMRFRSIRDADYPDYFIPDTTLYHLSYIRTDDQMKTKISSWGHAHEVNPYWFENVWQKWTPEMMNFHPTEPNIFYKSVVEVLPYEIRRRLKF